MTICFESETLDQQQTEKKKQAVAFSLTVLGSGSSGNCSLITAGDTHLLIDAGFSAKEIERRMQAAGFDAQNLTAVLVTHEHGDHVRSCHTLSHRYKIPLMATAGTFNKAVRDKRFFDWVEIQPGRGFSIGAMDIHPISLPHDAEDPVGFRVHCDERVIGHITDFGYASALVVESLKNCDLMVVEANHDLEMLKEGPYPWSLKQRIAGRLGHLSNDAMLEMLPEIVHDDLRHIVFAHLSRTNNDPRLVKVGVKRTLHRVGLPKLPFTIADQDQPTETFRL